MATAQLTAPRIEQQSLSSTAFETEKQYTPDEFMQLNIERAELVDGKVIKKMPASADHDDLVGNVYSSLRAFIKKHSLGRVMPGGSFLTEAGQVRGPDVAFISNEDLEGEDTSRYVSKPPTLAVEVVSLNDIYGDVDDKAAEFLRAGSKAVWIVNPRRRSVAVHTPDNTAVTYLIGDTIPGGDILPDFALPVADIFED